LRGEKELLLKLKDKNMEATVYNQKGKEVGKVKLPEAVFGLKWNADLVHQVVTSMESNARTPVAHTKDRGDVSGGGKKPWKQKGTGRARHGSTRSPIWVGGGVAHGPRNEKDYSRKVNKKMKAKALYTVLSSKFKEGKILFVDSFSFGKPQTKEAVSVLKNLSVVDGFSTLTTKRRNSAIVALSATNDNSKKSFSNISNILTEEVRNINPVDLLNYKYIIIENPEASLEFIASKLK
jgi:large subunit ribosomal protein L4